MSTTSDDQAGRMQVYAEVLVALAERADSLTDEDLRARLQFHGGMAREALARYEASGHPV